MKQKALHLHDALRLLKDGEPHRLKVWKLSTGDLLTYTDARFVGGHTTRGAVRVRLPNSGLIRQFKDVALCEIDDLTVYI